MVVNFTDNYQFNTRLSLDDNVLQHVSETRLLGVVFQDDLTWNSNTELIVKQAYKRMILLHRLYEFGLPTEEMINIYTLYIRSILESSAVVWHSAITQAEETDIERVQKVALRVILKSDYESYENALLLTGLDTLQQRRTILCEKFAKNCTKKKKNETYVPLEPELS